MLHAEWGTYATSDVITQPIPGFMGFTRDYGGYAVQFFWMISGFIFAFAYGKPGVGLWEYSSRRFARLYPLHFVTLLLVAVLQMLLVALVGINLFIPHNDLWHFVLNLFFISSLGLEAGPSFNWPIWSVVVEVPIYILFWFTVRYLPMNFLVALVISALFFLSQDYIRFTHVDYCGMLFFLGVALYYACQWFEAKVLAGVSAMAWVFGLLAIFAVPAVASSQTLTLVIVFSPLLTLFAGLDRMWPGKSEMLDRMARFGDLSYSIYLLHMPVMMALTALIVMLGIDRGILSGVWTIVAFVLVTIWLSRLSLKWIEYPARRWLRQALKPKPKLVSA